MIPVIYLAGGGAALGLTGLALRARAKRNAAALAAGTAAGAAAPAPSATAVATPDATAAALAASGVTLAQIDPNPVVAQQVAQAIVGQATAAGGSVADAILQAAAATDPNIQAQINPNSASPTQQGIVTTNDPAPSGDLNVFDAPNGNSIGRAEKDGVVIVFTDFSDPTFAKIHWAGGPRSGPIDGFAHKAFIRLV